MNIDKIIGENFSGACSVKKDGNILFQKAYGYADLANRIENEIGTKFATASAGKVFVAVAILQLIEQGNLRFEDNIGDTLDLDLRAIDPKITIEQLLNHTSGIPDYFDETIMEDYQELWRDFPNYNIRTCADLLPLFINKPMMYPAGKKFQYNNTGFVVLGLIIEKLTGMNFDKYLEKIIFEPCHMQETGYYELDRLPAKCANGYLYDENRNEYYTNIYSVDVKGTGAGGAFTTILDINHFWDALMGEKLISQEMVTKMMTPQSSNGKAYYGYGIWLKKVSDNEYIPYFQGCDPGVSFISSLNTINQVSITVVSNFGSNVWSIHKSISEELSIF